MSSPRFSSTLIPSITVSYPIVETFHSIQGEGYWSGVSAFFIRLAGCDVGCSWCDTKVSWPMAAHPPVAIAQLVEQVQQANPRIVVITGGEPLMHNLLPLSQALRATGYPLHLETSGAYPFTGEFDWVTLSPKTAKPPLPENYGCADELKMVIQTAADLAWAESQGQQVASTVPRFLQPEWSTPASQQLIGDYILNHPQWRLSLQTHKVLGVR